MSIWPKVEHGGHAIQHVITRPRVRVTAACYLSGVRSPLHVHPHHDQCVILADGTLTITTDQDNKTINAGEAVIIPAGRAHGFEGGTEETRFLSVFLGDGAEVEGKTTLPEKISKLLDPNKNRHEKLVETFLSPEHAGEIEDLSKSERDTLTWVVDRLLKRIETGRLKEMDRITNTPRKTQKIQAWQKDNSLFLWGDVVRMCISLTLKRGAGTSPDYVQLSDIDIHFPSMQKLPKVETLN